MLTRLKNLTPSALKPFLLRQYLAHRAHYDLWSSYLSDYRQYKKYSSKDAGSKRTHENLSAMIFMEAHGLEKAFSLPDIRAGFGKGRIETLDKLLNLFRDSGFSMNELAIQKASSVLNEYLMY